MTVDDPNDPNRSITQFLRSALERPNASSVDSVIVGMSRMLNPTGTPDLNPQYQHQLVNQHRDRSHTIIASASDMGAGCQ